MTLYDAVIAPILVDDSDTVTNPDKNDIKKPPANTAKTKNLPANTVVSETNTDNTEKGVVEKKSVNADEAEAEEPSINIGSINAEHRNDPNYVTYNINFTYAYYTDIVDGKEVKKPIPNMTGGTISIPKASVEEDTDSDIKDAETEPDNQSHGGSWGGGLPWSDDGRYDNRPNPEDYSHIIIGPED
jgi:hypothetical protein